MRRVLRAALLSAAFLLVVALAACTSSAPSGSLKVTVGGLPGGVDGAVMVTGPGGYAHVVKGTTTLTALALGTYTVAATPVSNGDAIVPTMFDGNASSSTLKVQANTTASTNVTYASRPGTGHLWVAIWPNSGSGQAVSISNAGLANSGALSTDATLTSSTDAGEAVAFDRAGNMWVSDWEGYIYEYDVAQLDGSGSTTPASTIDATAYGHISGLAFDAAGNLWAGVYDGSQVLGYTPAQVAAGGTVTPSVVIDANGTPSLAGPIALAFDPSGDLWVANSHGPETIVSFKPSQLATGTPTPAVTIAADSTPSLVRPGGLAFDANGNLWVANLTNNTVVRYDAAQLAAPGGTPTPAATIASGSFGSGGGPWGLAIDASGALWVSESYTRDLRRFTNPDALSGTVTPTPDTVLTGLPGCDMVQLAFSPTPANLPIHTP